MSAQPFTGSATRGEWLPLNEGARLIRYLLPEFDIRARVALLSPDQRRALCKYLGSGRAPRDAQVAALARVLASGNDLPHETAQQFGELLQDMMEAAELHESIASWCRIADDPESRTFYGMDKPEPNPVNPILEACDDLMQVHEDAVQALTQFLADGNRKEVEAALVNLAAIREAIDRAYSAAALAGVALEKTR